MKRTAFLFAAVQIMACLAYGQSINLTGTVVDSYGIPVKGAVVELLGESLADTTDATGNYAIVREGTNTHQLTLGSSTRLHGHTLFLSLGKKERVRVYVYDLQGKLLHNLLAKEMNMGDHTLNLAGILNSQGMRFLRIITGTQITTYKYVPVWGKQDLSNEGKSGMVMAKKSMAAVDTLVAMAGGFAAGIKPVESQIGQNDFIFTANPAPAAEVWKEIDLTPYGSDKGFYVSIGDLDNDGRVDYLLHRVGEKTVAGYVLALDHDGNKLWDFGNSNLAEHIYWGNEPPNRAISSVFDVDGDGKSEAVIEAFVDDTYQFYFLEGATGEVKASANSPFTDARVRNDNSSRPHPYVFFAYMDGFDKLPTIVFKYGASNRSETIAVGYDKDLNQKWIYGEDEGSLPRSMGHVGDVADIDKDGKEEILLGYVVLDDDGTKMWEPTHDLLNTPRDHADMVTAADILPDEEGMEVLIARCHGTPNYETEGELYAYSSTGEFLWDHTEYSNHTEMVLAGNFIEDLPGPEVMFQISHDPNYVTVDYRDGSAIKTFTLNGGNGYPDWPALVTWKNTNVQSVWMPIVRKLVDGNGNTVADLGDADARVVDVLSPGEVKKNTATQAFAVDIHGDERDEIIIYTREKNSNGIFIFTQSDNEGGKKTYVHQRSVYNIRTPN